MKSLKQLGIVLAISMGIVLMVVGSMWLAGLDSGMPIFRPTATFVLPTVTLHPTTTPTPKDATPTKESAETPTATPTETSELPTTTPEESTACEYPAGWIPNTLDNKNPDTLEKLAQLSIDEILEKNCYPKNTPLEVGMVLYLPDVLPTATLAATNTPKPGVTIKYTSTPKPVYTPIHTPMPTPTPIPGCTITWSPYVYIVQPGDTLYSLSRYLGVSINTLKLYNCLAGDLIVAGQKLYSPYPIPPTATPTPTLTMTPTATPTPTPTATETFTPTPTTDAPTATPTFTPSATSTPTATPDGGFIPTPVPTDDSETPTSTPVPTNTPIPTATNTPVS